MNITSIHTSIFKEKENLIRFIQKHIPDIEEETILVVTSKIVALAEGRTAEVEDETTKERCILAESDYAEKTKYTWLTIKNGVVMASAGIDESNANGKLILLPKDSFKTARILRNKLRKIYKLKRLGVIITDSRTLPLRAGVTGVALGYAGFKGIKDYRGKPDIFGRKFKVSRVDVADALATAAVYTMGEGSERQPLALISDSAAEFTEKVHRNELHISIEDDMYRPLLASLHNK